MGLLTLLLPETAGKPLPQTIQDVKDLYNNTKALSQNRKTVKTNNSEHD